MWDRPRTAIRGERLGGTHVRADLVLLGETDKATNQKSMDGEAL